MSPPRGHCSRLQYRGFSTNQALPRVPVTGRLRRWQPVTVSARFLVRLFTGNASRRTYLPFWKTPGTSVQKRRKNSSSSSPCASCLSSPAPPPRGLAALALPVQIEGHGDLRRHALYLLTHSLVPERCELAGIDVGVLTGHRHVHAPPALLRRPRRGRAATSCHLALRCIRRAQPRVPVHLG